MTDQTLTKICKSCGLSKPLSAFLQMHSDGGTRYGQICASCRKTQAEAAARLRKSEAESGGASETGHRIDAKARVQAEHDKRETRETIDEDYHEGRKDDEALDRLNKGKADVKLQTEKKVQSGLLNRRTFLGDNPKTTRTPTETPTLTAGEQAQEDLKKTGFNTNAPYIDPQIAGQTRFQGQAFLQYRQWLGKNSPLVKGAEAAMKRDAEKGKQSPEDPVEFIEHTWGPKSKR